MQAESDASVSLLGIDQNCAPCSEIGRRLRPLLEEKVVLVSLRSVVIAQTALVPPMKLEPSCPPCSNSMPMPKSLAVGLGCPCR